MSGPRKPRKGLKRSAPLTRSSAPKARKQPNAVNTKRRNREWARAYGSPERVAFIAALPCIVCEYRPSENAHITTGGMGRKADADMIIPLCKLHHLEQHHFGIETFGTRHGIELFMLAAATEAEWQLHCAKRGAA